MSLIIPRNFKCAKAHDAADKTEKIARDSAIVALFQPLADAQAELRDGNKKSNAKNVLAAAIAAAEKEFKGNPFSSRDKRIIDDAKKVLSQFDAAATDANFKVGDRVVSIKTGRKGKIVSPGGRYNPMYGHYGRHEMWNVLFDDEKERIPVLMGSEEIRLANSHSTDTRDSIAADAKFKVGDRVKCIKHTIMTGGRDAYGVVGRVELVDTGIFGPEDPIYEVSIAGHNYGTEIFAEEALVKA